MNHKDDILVEVKGVSKKFSRSLKQSMWYGFKDMGSALFGIHGNRSNLREGEFWAVKDVSFSLRRGECLGLIGHNGAGKSTLLKMLNGLIRPDEGSITIRGKIGALIELGAGFNPLLTGRENVFINGQLLGFSRKEVEKKLDAILDFAEIGEFIDSPVQNYSSGMKVRLGFAVAAQMEPDVLLIDEVLAVGDLGFRIKCLNRISELIDKCAVIFVSHSMPQIARICNYGILLENGLVLTETRDIGELIEEYNKLFENEYESNEVNPYKIKLNSIKINENLVGKEKQLYLDSDRGINLSFSFKCPIDVKLFSVHIPITDKQLIHVAMTSSLVNLGATENKGEIVTVNCYLPNVFTNGKFYLGITIIENFMNERHFNIGRTIYKIENCFSFIVRNAPLTTSVPILLNSNFSIENE
jgi:lipopolysaccharide transport system ATP-binding protein